MYDSFHGVIWCCRISKAGRGAGVRMFGITDQVPVVSIETLISSRNLGIDVRKLTRPGNDVGRYLGFLWTVWQGCQEAALCITDIPFQVFVNFSLASCFLLNQSTWLLKCIVKKCHDNVTSIFTSSFGVWKRLSLIRIFPKESRHLCLNSTWNCAKLKEGILWGGRLSQPPGIG